MGKYVVFMVALVAFAGLFYMMDLSMMLGQGLPVGANLMPK